MNYKHFFYSCFLFLFFLIPLSFAHADPGTSSITVPAGYTGGTVTITVESQDANGGTVISTLNVDIVPSTAVTDLSATKNSCSSGFASYTVHAVSTVSPFYLQYCSPTNTCTTFTGNELVTTASGRDYTTGAYVEDNSTFKMLKVSDGSTILSTNITATGCGLCGNGAINSPEQCDGSNLNGKSCTTQGYTSGSVSCNANCTLNTSACVGSANICGNNIVEGSEVCDGTSLNGGSCTTQGYTGGTISCNATCTGYVTSSCTSGPLCGNGVINGTEQCDGGNLNGNSCVTSGYIGGSMSCNADCTLNTNACIANGSPNLSASAVSPSAANVGVPIQFTTIVFNTGGGTTGKSFYTLFQVATAANGGGTVSAISANTTSLLIAGGSTLNSSSAYTFPTAGTYSVRACADNNTSMIGTIAESNEADNCGAWTNVTVTTPDPVAPNLKLTVKEPWNPYNIAQSLIDGPYEAWYYSPYTLSWGKVANDTTGITCTLDGLLVVNGVNISPDGGTVNMTNLTTSKTHNLTCNRPFQVSVNDAATVTVPPTPTNLSKVCNAAGTSMTLSWNIASGYPGAFFRAAVGSFNYTSDPAFADDTAGTSKTITVTPNTTYHVWVFTRTAANHYGTFVDGNYSCSPVSIPSVTLTSNPISPVPVPTNVDLIWETHNVVSCTASGGWSGSKTATDGTHTQSVAVNGTTSYTITCVDPTNKPTVANLTVTATAPKTLTVTPSIGGVVESTDGNISCDPTNTCTHTYPTGTNVTLTATPISPNWKFVGWTASPAVCTGAGSCTFTVNANTTIQAIFTPRPVDYKEF